MTKILCCSFWRFLLHEVVIMISNIHVILIICRKKGCCIYLLNDRKYRKDYLDLNASWLVYFEDIQNKKATAGFESDNRSYLMWKMYFYYFTSSKSTSVTPPSLFPPALLLVCCCPKSGPGCAPP